MEKDLKSDFLATIFQFKNLLNARFSGGDDVRFNLNEILLLRGVTAGRTLTQISSELGLTASALSQHLNVLDDRGDVSRRIDQRDRRHVVVELTPQAQADFDKAERAFDRTFTSFVEAMGVDQLEQLIALMERTTELLGKAPRGKIRKEKK